MGNAGNLPGKVGGANALLVTLVDESSGVSAEVSAAGLLAVATTDGATAAAFGTNPTAVAAGALAALKANRAGVSWVLGGHPNIVTVEAAYTGAQTDAAVITQGAGGKIVVTQCAAVCDNANTVDVGIRVGFGASTTPTTTGVVLTHPGIAPGSGYNRGDGSGMLGVGADGEDLRVTSEVPTGGSVRVLVSYFTIES